MCSSRCCTSSESNRTRFPTAQASFQSSRIQEAQLDRRQVIKGAMTGALTLWASPMLRAAQQASAAAGVKRVTDRLSVVDAGTNVIVFSGGDGLLLVDSGAPKSGDKLTAALKGIAASSK